MAFLTAKLLTAKFLTVVMFLTACSSLKIGDRRRKTSLEFSTAKFLKCPKFLKCTVTRSVCVIRVHPGFPHSPRAFSGGVCCVRTGAARPRHGRPCNKEVSRRLEPLAGELMETPVGFSETGNERFCSSADLMLRGDECKTCNKRILSNT